MGTVPFRMQAFDLYSNVVRVLPRVLVRVGVVVAVVVETPVLLYRSMSLVAVMPAAGQWIQNSTCNNMHFFART